MRKLLKWLRRKNEFTFVIALIALIWYAAPGMFRMIDPQSGEFGIEVLYVPFIAGIYFFIALVFIWAYMALVWPKGYRLLDTVFETENLTSWERLQALLRLFGCLVALFAVSLLAVTGLSAII